MYDLQAVGTAERFEQRSTMGSEGHLKAIPVALSGVDSKGQGSTKAGAKLSQHLRPRKHHRVQGLLHSPSASLTRRG